MDNMRRSLSQSRCIYLLPVISGNYLPSIPATQCCRWSRDSQRKLNLNRFSPATARYRVFASLAALVVGASTFAIAAPRKPKNPNPKPAPELATAVDTLPNSMIKWDMVQIPAGEITMPDRTKAGATKKVAIKSFWIGKTEVLWELFDVFAYRLDLTDEEKAKGVEIEVRPSKPYGAPDRGFGHKGFPALSMHFPSAKLFCDWLSRKTGKKYRVPTEAEWEYAARAGNTSATSFDDAALKDIAWYWENADDATHAAGKKKPNAWGLYDMLGNAAEWVAMPDGTGTLAGGSFDDKAAKVQYGGRAYYKVEWQTQDAHTPKSKWWLSDGPFAGMRIIRED